jgi:hypothetical protein
MYYQYTRMDVHGRLLISKTVIIKFSYSVTFKTVTIYCPCGATSQGSVQKLDSCISSCAKYGK